MRLSYQVRDFKCLDLSVPDEGKSRKPLQTHEIIKCVVFNFLHHWVDTSAGGLSVPEGIISSVVSTSVLT